MHSSNRLVRPSQLRVRAPRVPMDIEVHSRTIGTDAAYSLITEDISRSGLLLRWERVSKMPFIINTLIEITIDPLGKCLGKPVSCLGKVVRRDLETDDIGPSVRLGIQIVQIDNSDLVAWEVCVSELERRFGIEATNKIVTAAS